VSIWQANVSKHLNQPAKTIKLLNRKHIITLSPVDVRMHVHVTSIEFLSSVYIVHTFKATRICH